MAPYWGLTKALQNTWRESEQRERELQQTVDQVARERGLSTQQEGQLLREARYLLQEQRHRAAEQAWVRFFESCKCLLWRIFLLLFTLLILGALIVVNNWVMR